MAQTLVTIEEARKMLGEKGKTMTNKQIEKLLNLLYSLSNSAIETVVSEFSQLPIDPSPIS